MRTRSLSTSVNVRDRLGKRLSVSSSTTIQCEESGRCYGFSTTIRANCLAPGARTLAPAPKARDKLSCVIVGHLREEKDPATLLAAIGHIPRDIPVTFRHIGAPLDAKLAAQARALQRRDPRYRYVGALGHGLTRCAIRAAHLLVHPSLMEGGANVIVEAVTAGTAVLASRVSGNVGMLGAGYEGYFAHDDAAGLADLLLRCRRGQQAPTAALLPHLGAQCALRAPLFAPEAERSALLRLVAELMDSSS